MIEYAKDISEFGVGSTYHRPPVWIKQGSDARNMTPHLWGRLHSLDPRQAQQLGQLQQSNEPQRPQLWVVEPRPRNGGDGIHSKPSLQVATVLQKEDRRAS